MNGKNMGCWGAVLGGLLLLMIVGNSQPIRLEHGARSPLSHFWGAAEVASVAGAREPGLQSEDRPPAPPPEPLTRKDAEEVIHISACARRFDQLAPQLRRSIRIGTLPAADLDEIPQGASRLAAGFDLPPGFAWPKAGGRPMTPLAQMNLAEVANLDEDGLLPKRGWLCFFYALDLKPAVRGWKPTDRTAWRVVHFTGEAEKLEHTEPPATTDTAATEFRSCCVRFWKEWTLPAPAEEPGLLAGDATAFGYADLCEALAGRPDEPGWHHLLGHAQNVGGFMRQICQLASNGVEFREDMDPGEPQVQELLADAPEWRLLLQIDLAALRRADVADPETGLSGFFCADRLYFWIREADLRDKKFERVWVVRQGSFEFDDDSGPNGDSADTEAAGD